MNFCNTQPFLNILRIYKYKKELKRSARHLRPLGLRIKASINYFKLLKILKNEKTKNVFIVCMLNKHGSSL